MKTSAAAPVPRRVGRSVPYPWRVSEAVWAVVGPLLADPPRRFRSPGRCRYSARACLEGILYVLRYGIPWRALPAIEGFPSGQTCWRRLEEWEKAGVWPALMSRLQALLVQAERLDWSRAIVDASLVDAKRGARRSRAPSAAAPAAAST